MDYVSLYCDFLKTYASVKRPMSVVCDASNGATGKILQMLLPELSLKASTLINETPDPEFPAHGPNPLAPGALDELTKTVLEKNADFGVAFDADGDRVFFVDEKGNQLSSFVIGALLFKYSKPPYVADELVYQALKHMNVFPAGGLHPSRVGVFFIKQVMKEVGAPTGAEFSGHFYFRDFFGADSGIFTFIRVLSILSAGTESLSEFAASLPQHTVRNVDLKIAGKNWEEIQRKIVKVYKEKGAGITRLEGITLELPNGWTNIRTSNTEPTLRIYAGAATAEEADQIVADITALV